MRSLRVVSVSPIRACFHVTYKDFQRSTVVSVPGTASQAVGILRTFSNYGPPRTFGGQIGMRLGG